jgi:hypothetical protein
MVAVGYSNSRPAVKPLRSPGRLQPMQPTHRPGRPPPSDIELQKYTLKSSSWVPPPPGRARQRLPHGRLDLQRGPRRRLVALRHVLEGVLRQLAAALAQAPAAARAELACGNWGDVAGSRVGRHRGGRGLGSAHIAAWRPVRRGHKLGGHTHASGVLGPLARFAAKSAGRTPVSEARRSSASRSSRSDRIVSIFVSVSPPARGLGVQCILMLQAGQIASELGGAEH